MHESSRNNRTTKKKKKDPHQYSPSKTKYTAVSEIFQFAILEYILVTQKHRGMKKRARSVTAVARKEGQRARWPGGQAATLEVRGGQATRRRTICLHSRERAQTCCNWFFFVLGGFSIVLRGSHSRKSDPAITCQIARL